MFRRIRICLLPLIENYLAWHYLLEDTHFQPLEGNYFFDELDSFSASNNRALDYWDFYSLD